MLAAALDVRQVFLGMSALVREIVPHGIVAFALLSPDRGGSQDLAAEERRIARAEERAIQLEARVDTLSRGCSASLAGSSTRCCGATGSPTPRDSAHPAPERVG